MTDPFKTSRDRARYSTIQYARQVHAPTRTRLQARIPIGTRVRCQYREAIYEGVVADHDPLRKTTCVRVGDGRYVHPSSKSVEVLT
jgi:hypothetical protein